MAATLKDLIQRWDGQAVISHFDTESGSWFFIAMHNTSRGLAVGGCRMKSYLSPEEALVDAMRLAEGMTYKWAGVDVPYGGGKAVIAVPGPVEGGDRRALLTRFGQLVDSLHGAFACGVDLGTTPADFEYLSTVTPYVMGLTSDRKSVDPGSYTALGVFTGLKIAVKHAFSGDDSLVNRRILIQGVGDVGRPLAELLKTEGAKLIFADIDESIAGAAAAEFGGEVVAPGAAYYTECDVYAPCAVGATLNSSTIPKLFCKAVAGSANNQLETTDDADRLHQRGILYAPDYIINAGGAIAFALIHGGEEEKENIRRRVRQIGKALDDIFNQAADNDETPEKTAKTYALTVLTRARETKRQSAA